MRRVEERALCLECRRADLPLYAPDLQPFDGAVYCLPCLIRIGRERCPVPRVDVRSVLKLVKNPLDARR